MLDDVIETIESKLSMDDFKRISIKLNYNSYSVLFMVELKRENIKMKSET